MAYCVAPLTGFHPSSAEFEVTDVAIRPVGVAQVPVVNVTVVEKGTNAKVIRLSY